MKLLPKKGEKTLKKQPVKQEVQLNEDNNQLIEAINQKVKEFNLVKSGIEIETENLKKNLEEIKAKLVCEINELRQVVESLEARRIRAIEPLDAEWDRLSQDKKQFKIAEINFQLLVDDHYKQIENEKQQLSNKVLSVDRKLNEFQERENRIVDKESSLVARSNQLRVSEENLNKKWLSYYEREVELSELKYLIEEATEVLRGQADVKKSWEEKDKELRVREGKLVKNQEDLKSRELVVINWREDVEKEKEFSSKYIKELVKRELGIKSSERLLENGLEDLKHSKQTLQIEWDRFNSALDNKNRKLRLEVEKLEARRLKALLPIESKRKEFESWKNKFEAKAKSVAEQEFKNNLKTEELDNLELRLASKENGLKQRESAICEQSDRLGIDVREYERNRRQWQFQKENEWKEIEAQKVQIERLKLEIDAKEEMNQKILDNFKLQQAIIDKDRKHLESQQQTLKVAFEEARRKDLL